MKSYDFSGWATKHNVKCSDGRTIMKDAFKHNDGQTVPLVWNHQHNDPLNVLGHALLENREGGVYTYCTFNDTEAGQNAKLLVQHGDVVSLSIYANQLKQQGGNVLHGAIREVSLVLAGANPEAHIDKVLAHGMNIDAMTPEEYEDALEHSEEAYIFIGEEAELTHSEASDNSDKEKENVEDKKETTKEPETEEKTVQEVFDSMTEEQKTVVYALLGEALKDDDADNNENKSEGGNSEMKQNAFDQNTKQDTNVLSHADQTAIINLAKTTGVGSFRNAMEIYAESNDTLAHGIDTIETLFPDFKTLGPNAPELITDDNSWVAKVINKIHKSPISRIRTRKADARAIADLRAKGYKKGTQKTNMGNIKLVSRTTDPQTIYIKDSLHRDDIIDITDFDVVAYNYAIMLMQLKMEVATAALFGDGREDGDPDKIGAEHIRPIWTDDELYTIHVGVDIAKARTELQGTGTSVSFGDNYVYAEAVITAALYSREQYKGSGSLDFYCTPHLLNVMLLARDMNGRRIYDSKADLAAALNVNEIITIEQMEGKVRKDADGNYKKLLGLFVNLSDYQFGSTKGGEITRFNQFDIDFNQEKYLIETRLSGALTKIKSAIALEEPTTAPEENGEG